MSRDSKRDLIVGLDIGTSKIVSVVAELNPEGQLAILGIGSHQFEENKDKGLKRGAPWARILFTIVLVIAIIGDIGQIIAGGSVSSAWWGIAIDVIALVVLYGPESSRKHFSR